MSGGTKRPHKCGTGKGRGCSVLVLKGLGFAIVLNPQVHGKITGLWYFSISSRLFNHLFWSVLWVACLLQDCLRSFWLNLDLKSRILFLRRRCCKMLGRTLFRKKGLVSSHIVKSLILCDKWSSQKETLLKVNVLSLSEDIRHSSSVSM